MKNIISNLAIIAIASLLTACEFGGAKPCFEMSSKTLTELDKIYPGEDVYFNNCSSDGLAFSWDFGDGTTADLKSPHHTFEAAGDYTVTLTVETEKKSKSLSKDITVSPSLYGTWAGEATTAQSNTIPIAFNIVQEGSRIKGSFVYGTGSNPGVISSHSNIDGQNILIKCSYVSVFFFDGEEFSFNSLFSFEGTVDENFTIMQGDEFSVGQQQYGSWSVTKQ